MRFCKESGLMDKKWQKRDLKQYTHPVPRPPLKRTADKSLPFLEFFCNFFCIFFVSIYWSIFIVLDALYNAYIGVSFGLYRTKRFGMID